MPWVPLTQQFEDWWLALSPAEKDAPPHGSTTESRRFYFSRSGALREWLHSIGDY